MHRRRYLATLAGVSLGGIAGCLGDGQSSDRTNATAEITGRDGRPGDICSAPARPDRIPAIVDPSFAPDYSDLSRASLRANTPVIGIARDDTARAYPVPLLARYEIVNDRFDVPILVTYCPLCSSGLTASRTIEGTERVFENTSHTWRAPTRAGRAAIEEDRVFGASYRGGGASATATNDPNLVMYDVETRSYWSQLLAQAICGPLTGTRLPLVPSTVATWRDWRETHPETTVLLPPPHSVT